MRVARRDDVAPGEIKQVRCGQREIALANVAGAIYAFDAYCPHAAWPLTWGGIEEGLPARLQCTLHGWLFDLATGDAVIPGIPRCLPVWEARIDGEHIVVRCREATGQAGGL